MLTIKQEKFVQNLINGMSQREAYKQAYNVNYSEKAIDNRASELFKKGEVQVRYNELVKELKDESIMSAKERMLWLSKVVKGEVKEKHYYYSDNEYVEEERESDINTKIRAVDTLNKMDNSYKQNINVSGSISNPYSGLTEEELRKLAGDD